MKIDIGDAVFLFMIGSIGVCILVLSVDLYARTVGSCA